MGIKNVKLRRNLRFFIIGFLIFSKVYAQESYFEDKTNDADIKTILFYAYNSTQDFTERSLVSPVLNIKSNGSLIVEFDDLKASYRQFVAKIVHCDLNWQKSTLNDMEILEGFNDYVINTYEVSQNTKVPYYHYRFKVPTPKITGNFVLQVFEGSTSDKMVFQKQFYVYEQKIGITAQVIIPQDVSIWRTHQQINLSLDLNRYYVNFPQKELEVFIRQNQRSNKTIHLDSRLLSSSGQNTFKFRYFNNENTFEAGNEFRFVDVTNAFSKGNNVKETFQGKTDKVMLVPQGFRSNKNYLNAYDNNGRFIIKSLDASDVDLGSDYMEIKFVLDQNKMEPNLSPLVLGAFNNWSKDEGIMDFNPNTQFYEKSFILKQGIYDFAFSKYDSERNIIDDSFFEGNFSDTNNVYEIFVYHKSPSGRAHSLVGYQKVNNYKD